MNKQDVLGWINTHPVATVATLSASVIPQLAQVYTYVDADYNCYFITKEGTRKYENVTRTKTATLSWFDEASFVTCEVSGVAGVVERGDEVAVALTQLQGIIAKQKTGYWIPPVGQLDGSNYVVLRVTPEMVRYIDYSSQDGPAPQSRLFEFLL